MHEASPHTNLSALAWQDLRERLDHVLPSDRPLRLQHPRHGTIHHGNSDGWQVVRTLADCDGITIAVPSSSPAPEQELICAIRALVDAARESESLSGELVATYAALAALDGLGRRLPACRNLDALGQALQDAICQQLSGRGCAILRMENGSWRISSWWGGIDADRFAFGDDLQELIDLGRPRIVDAGLPPTVLGSSDAPRSCAWMSVPLRTSEETGGLLLLARDDQPFTSNDAKFCELLAGPAAAQALELQRASQLRLADAMRREMQVAGQIQQRMLPQHTPDTPGYGVRGHLQTASTVGGDYYDHLTCGDRLVLVIADVSGHSVGAALAMSMVRTTLRSLAPEHEQPDELLALTNRAVCDDLISSGLFVSATIACLDLPSGRLRLACAGHPPAYIRRRDGSLEQLDADGMVLGYLPNVSFTSAKANLAPGDGLLFYTDGVIEAQHPTGKYFGDELLQASLARPCDHADQLVDNVLLAVQEWSFSQRVDDLTLLCCMREPLPEHSATS